MGNNLAERLVVALLVQDPLGDGRMLIYSLTTVLSDFSMLGRSLPAVHASGRLSRTDPLNEPVGINVLGAFGSNRHEMLWDHDSRPDVRNLKLEERDGAVCVRHSHQPKDAGGARVDEDLSILGGKVDVVDEREPLAGRPLVGLEDAVFDAKVLGLELGNVGEGEGAHDDRLGDVWDVEGAEDGDLVVVHVKVTVKETNGEAIAERMAQDEIHERLTDLSQRHCILVCSADGGECVIFCGSEHPRGTI